MTARSNEDDIENAIDKATGGKMIPEVFKKVMPKSYATLRAHTFTESPGLYQIFTLARLGNESPPSWHKSFDIVGLIKPPKHMSYSETFFFDRDDRGGHGSKNRSVRSLQDEILFSLSQACRSTV